MITTTITTPTERRIGPQAGAQTVFLQSAADIAIGGGSRGGGKTWALLLEPLYHIDNPDFGAVILRREMPRITQEGGMWNESFQLYPHVRGRPRESPDHDWTFPSGASVTFKHCQHESDRLSFSGSQIPLLGIDQLEEFTASQFWFLWSGCRWAGSPERRVRPYFRGTCNPVPEDDPVGGWLHRFLAWWIDPVTGYAIPSRSGIVRWLIRDDDDAMDWADDPAMLRARHGADARPISVTFVRMGLADNPALTAKDPGYDAKLRLLPRVERERLREGNWNVRAVAGLVFDRAWFDVIAVMPSTVIARCRAWDKAGTEGGGKWSAGVRVARTTDGRYVIEDVVRGQWSAENRERVIVQCAASDPPGTVIWHEQEPGSGGKESAELTTRRLAGYAVHAERVTGDKLTRSAPLRAQAEARNVPLLLGSWNDAFLRECHNWSGDPAEVCDQIDAAALAFAKLALGSGAGQMLRIRGF